jgi:flagellar biosynthesis/type III secretory pathway protein FliH
VPNIKDFQPKELGVESTRTHGVYQPKELNEASQVSYQDVKKKYGALAATDTENVSRTKKEASFKLNPDARRLLGVEDEEKSQYSEVVRQEVDRQVQELRVQAHEAGFQEGLRKGTEEANAQVLETSKEHFARLEALLSSLDCVKDEVARANETLLVDLVFHISKALLLKDLKVDREYVARLAASIIERLGVRDHVKIKVSSADFKDIAQLKERIQARVGELRNLQILESDEIQLGGCKVESELAAVDATVETQLESMRLALEDKDANSQG